MPLFREYEVSPLALDNCLPSPYLCRNYPETEGKHGAGVPIRPEVLHTPHFIERAPGEARLPPLNSTMNLSGLPTRFLLGGQVLPKKSTVASFLGLSPSISSVNINEPIRVLFYFHIEPPQVPFYIFSHVPKTFSAFSLLKY